MVAGSLVGPADYHPATNRITWNGTLDTGHAFTIGYRLQLDSPLPEGAAIRNAAQLSDESGLAVQRMVHTRIDTPDLSSSVKLSSAQTASSGQVLTYTLALRNQGLRPATALLNDPVPLYTEHVPGSAQASSGQVTSTAGAVWWSGTIDARETVSIIVPVWISTTATGLYILNHATLDDGWGHAQPLEAYTRVDPARFYLPVVFKHK
jgi:uncharacterized repeat protein (TIGR01451 family)